MKKINQKKFSLKFKKVFNEIYRDINTKRNIFGILHKDLKFNFNIKELKKFQKYKKIVLIGMGGSILGAEAIHNFLRKKIKKKNLFFQQFR